MSSASEYDVIPQEQLPDGRWVSVFYLTFGRARITLGRDPMSYERSW